MHADHPSIGDDDPRARLHVRAVWISDLHLGTPDDLAKRNRAETVKWEKAIRDAKIEAQ